MKLEHDLKNFILHSDFINILKQNGIYVDEKNDKVYYEKTIDYGKVIVDSLIIDKNYLIGIEMKSGKDNLKRLKKQLESYIKVCPIVFVLVHDTHAPEVELMLNKYSELSCVGIISYDEFDDNIIAGLYKPASYNSNFNIFNYINSMENKQDLVRFINTEFGLKSFEGNSLSSFTSGRFSKAMLVKQLVHLIPDNSKMIQTINGYELSLKDSRDVARRFKRFHDKYRMGFKNYSESERLKYLKR